LNKELQQATQLAAGELELELKETDHARWKELLAEKIDDLIRHDFQKLVNILYRMDVSETRLRAMLEENTSEPAGMIIAGLMIDRQDQKIKSREMFWKNNNAINDEDAW